MHDDDGKKPIDASSPAARARYIYNRFKTGPLSSSHTRFNYLPISFIYRLVPGVPAATIIFHGLYSRRRRRRFPVNAYSLLTRTHPSGGVSNTSGASCSPGERARPSVRRSYYIGPENRTRNNSAVTCNSSSSGGGSSFNSRITGGRRRRKT